MPRTAFGKVPVAAYQKAGAGQISANNPLQSSTRNRGLPPLQPGMNTPKAGNRTGLEATAVAAASKQLFAPSQLQMKASFVPKSAMPVQAQAEWFEGETSKWTTATLVIGGLSTLVVLGLLIYLVRN